MSPHPSSATLIWSHETDTQAFARRLAAQPGVRQAFIELQGDLGAGKTTFVRHLLRELGVQGRIKSPTYAVVEPHEARQGQEGEQVLRIWHFDFYRFNDPREWEEAGFRDLFASPGLKLAEWPDKAQGMLPTPDLVLQLQVLGPDGPVDPAPDDDESVDAAEAPAAARQVVLTAATPLGQTVLEALRA
jgi:tRNA threonylcarbamoyladenosine biosynthesis protein TsaE